MKAWMFYDVGGVQMEDVEKPVPKPGEVLVKVSAASICGSDIPRIYRDGAHKQPIILGHEFSGVVEKVGEGVERHWLGRHVGVFPLIPCKACSMCRLEHYELCRDYNYLGSRCNGGFAEYVAVPEWNLVDLPGAVSSASAAMLEPMAVAVHAMRWAKPERDGSVAVIGLGPIGLFLLMFLKEAGYEKVYAVGNKELQREKAMLLGIREADYCDAGENDATAWLLEHTDGHGVDAVFECVGRNETYAQAVSAAGALGQIILVGNPSTDMMLIRDVYWKILRKELRIYGTWNSSFWKNSSDDWHYVLERISGGRIHPEWMISHRFSFLRLEEGLEMMRHKTEDYLKVMVEL